MLQWFSITRTNHILTEWFTLFCYQIESLCHVTDINKIIVLGSCSELKRFSVDNLTKCSIYKTWRELTYPISIGNHGPKKVNTDIYSNRFTHAVSNVFSHSIDIPHSRSTSLIMDSSFNFILHNRTSTYKTAATQLFCRLHTLYRIECILHLKIVIDTSLTSWSGPGKVNEGIIHVMLNVLEHCLRIGDVTLHIGKIGMSLQSASNRAHIQSKNDLTLIQKMFYCITANKTVSTCDYYFFHLYRLFLTKKRYSRLSLK